MRLPNLLSWSFVCPSADIPDAQVSPTSPRRAPLRMSGANRTSRSASVVSLHRDGLLCAPAPDLLQPGTGHGVHCVSAFPEPERETSLDRPGPVGRLPRNAVRTPRRIPLVSSRTASLRPFPSCGYHLFRLRVPARSEERASSNSPPPPVETDERLHPPGRSRSVRGESPRDSRSLHRRSDVLNDCDVAPSLPGRNREANLPRKESLNLEPSKLGPPCRPKATRARSPHRPKPLRTSLARRRSVTPRRCCHSSETLPATVIPESHTQHRSTEHPTLQTEISSLFSVRPHCPPKRTVRFFPSQLPKRLFQSE